MNEMKSIAIAFGDGIGPEIMEATLAILKEAKARIKVETIALGKKLYESGYTSGIGPDAWKTIKDAKVILKSPITTPQGGGYKSLNVTLRKALNLYANVRPCKSFHPFIHTKHPILDLIVVRENEEDLYAGVEYRQTHNMYQSIKMISRTGCEKIVRYAFEYARCNNRKKVTCFSKDNIMKFTDGVFHKVFDEIAKEYPEIKADHYIIDIGSARLANKPEIFDVIVTLNLYGDIISDIAAEISGSVGLAGSANVGTEYAMFEAIHGSAPDIAGKDIANPSGLINAAIMMLNHIGQSDIAENIQNALFCTIEEGIHTADIYNPSVSKIKVGTKEFTQELIKRLGKKPQQFKPVAYNDSIMKQYSYAIDKAEVKQLVGVDIYIDWQGDNAAKLADEVNELTKDLLKLQVISCCGFKVWPADNYDYILSDQWRLRFVPNNKEKIITHKDIITLLKSFADKGFDVIRTENLYSFDGKLGFALVQGD